MRWLDSIKEATCLRLDVLKEAVQDRKKWRMLVDKQSANNTGSAAHANVDWWEWR